MLHLVRGCAPSVVWSLESMLAGGQSFVELYMVVNLLQHLGEQRSHVSLRDWGSQCAVQTTMFG